MSCYMKRSFFFFFFTSSGPDLLQATVFVRQILTRSVTVINTQELLLENSCRIRPVDNEYVDN